MTGTGPHLFTWAKKRTIWLAIAPAAVSGQRTARLGFAADTAVMRGSSRSREYPGCILYIRIVRLHAGCPPGSSGAVGYSTTFFMPAGTGRLSGQNHAV